MPTEEERAALEALREKLTPEAAARANEGLKERIRKINNLIGPVPRPEVEEEVAESPRDEEAYREECLNAARSFLDNCSLPITKDAVEQLVDAFLPALAIMCERDYAKSGISWRLMGWRGLLLEFKKRVGRIYVIGWLGGRHAKPDAIDALNYLGYYIRLENEGKPYGDWDEPDPA